MAAATVIGALRRFLPDFPRTHPAQGSARLRAIHASTHCRTAAMGGHVHACARCGSYEFAYHSCNHRACPQCGREATAKWVSRELEKRVGAPYFMVTFTLPQELRALFFSYSAKACYDVLFAAASQALSNTLADPRWLGAQTSGLTMILHTWHQRLLFHPHIHCIVPGAGLDASGRVVSVKNPGFLVPQPVLRTRFRTAFQQKLDQLKAGQPLPGIDPAVWQQDWGVHIQPFGSGENIIKYLGAYVCRTAISDSRILKVTDTHVTFSWKDRAHNNARRTETLTGILGCRLRLPASSPYGQCCALAVSRLPVARLCAATFATSCHRGSGPSAATGIATPPPGPNANASPSTPKSRSSSVRKANLRKSRPAPAPAATPTCASSSRSNALLKGGAARPSRSRSRPHENSNNTRSYRTLFPQPGKRL